MARFIDLSPMYASGTAVSSSAGAFEHAYGRRPELVDGKVCLVEPLGGLKPEPLLRLGRLVDLSDENGAARSLDTLLSTKLWDGLASAPLGKVDPGLGFLSDLGQNLRDAFSAVPGKALIETLATKTIPYFRGLGATHACALRRRPVGRGGGQQCFLVCHQPDEFCDPR